MTFMKSKKQILFTALLLASALASAQQWPAIEADCRPGSRWWWMGSAVDTANLRRNIGQYAQAGLGTLEITPIYGVKGSQNNISYLSDQWMEMLRFTQAEAARQGMKIDMNNGTGWPFGGPEVSVEDAASCALFMQFDAKGGEKLNLDVAYRTDDPRQKKQEKVAKLLCLMAYRTDAAHRTDGSRAIELTRFVRDNRLDWQAPAGGDWKLVALYLGKTFQKVKRAAPGGEGLVVDHLNPAALKRYFQKFDDAFSRTGTAYPATFFNDSYEVYGADWTEDFLTEFKRRRGYRLQDHLLDFLKDTEAADGHDFTRRLVADYRLTLGELLVERFTRPWAAWAKQHGSLTRNQAHGSPANLIDTYAAVDIPECEGFGLTDFHIKGLRTDSLVRPNDSDISMLKYASSAAHITGKPLSSSETFTWLTEHFRTSLSQCKPDVDLMFLSGVNHMFFHGTTYSPAEAQWPGWKFYASIDMSPTNTIWRDAPAFFDYISRCQSFLQMGRPDNDFLVYLPVYDMWHQYPGRYMAFDIHKMDQYAPGFIRAIRSILSTGYDVDYISDAFIASTRYRDGQLVTQGGSAYRAIIVPDVTLMPETTMKQLLALARKGATVVFLDRMPGDVPGLSRLEHRRKQFAALTAQVKGLPLTDDGSRRFAEVKKLSFGKGTIIVGADYAEALRLTGVAHEQMKTENNLQFIRRRNARGHHYFISCLQPGDVDAWVTLAVSDSRAMIFNPMNGRKGLAQTRRAADGKLQVRLQMRSGESLILQTFAEAADPSAAVQSPVDLSGEAPWRYLADQSASLSLDHGWKLTFTDSTPAIPGTFDIDTPTSWTALPIPEAKTNMGTARYTLEVSLPAMQADEWVLDLGDVRESARVRVNGQDAGVAWAAPFRLEVGHLLRPAGEKNLIEIEVTNLPANRIAQLDREGFEWRKFEDINMAKLNYKKGKYDTWSPLPSGLNGGVRLIPQTRK